MTTQAAERAPRNATTTTTATATTTGSPVNSTSNPSGTLRLRAVSTENRHIKWAEDVVDNEGMGKKSSKVCCIYHKPREVGESSDEDSSDSSSDESDSEPDTSRAHPRGQGLGRRQHHQHDTPELSEGQAGTDGGEGSEEQPRKQARSKQARPNAYEKMPRNVTHKSNSS
ncbi:hypothetical protein EV356DRAFT_528525 [Viridothelium virens]|uniref:Type 1 phosphatases regulator n=1 Tax=Viridothelium virens TaxID=1048519 RepID=A0A6A6HP45_VIRVR|nr:hypothetical protein EV356DRAFT_528525 [Viridothelium virens]